MDDADADIDAFVTDVNAASGYQLFDFRLRFSAEGAADLVVFMSVVFTHLFSPFLFGNFFAGGYDLINQAEFQSVFRGHKIVTVHRFFNHRELLPRIFGIDVV